MNKTLDRGNSDENLFQAKVIKKLLEATAPLSLAPVGW